VKQEGEGRPDGRSDAELLASVDGDPAAYGVFYERHATPIFGYLLHLTRNDDVALEMTAEVFATALHRSRRLRRRKEVPRKWLLQIAAETLADSYRDGGIKDSARRKLGVPVEPRHEEWAVVAERISSAKDGPLAELARRRTSIRDLLRRTSAREAR
jgi:DNA-directed RNA polymerase specialized sigma24 family protein